jgi:predicted Zn-dependent protease
MLPSEDDAILAFAEVATFMDAYVSRYGKGALRTGLESIAAGKDARAALGAAAGNEFKVLESEWRAGIAVDAPELGSAQNARTLKTRFKEGENKADESDDVVETTARKHMRIGDLLWDRGRASAAAKEYEKANRADPLDPIVAARWGRAALASGNPKGAVQALTPQTTLYPTHAPTHAVLGAAYLALGQKNEAARALREAVWLNPFDPDPQCGLAEASSDATEIARARRACALLRAQ